MSGFLQTTGGGLLLRVKVQPRAPKHAIAGPLGDELKIRIAAPPVDSAANEALVRFLAARLACPRRGVEIVHGHRSPHKVLKLHGMTAAQAAEKLQGGEV
jgi:uncharacterized protein